MNAERTGESRVQATEKGSRTVSSRGRGLVAAVAGLALGLSGCAVTPPPEVRTPSPSATVTSSTPAATGTATPSSPATTPSGTTPVASATPGSPSGSASPTASSAPPTAAVKATGKLLTFTNLVSDQLTGTCQTVSQVPTFTLADKANDFYGTVTASARLTAAKSVVDEVRLDFGEDQEGVTRKLVHPASGTSATVADEGSRYTLKGKLMMYEGASKSGSLVPFTLTVECAGSSW
ncbi:MAG: lipoprotein LpqH [Propionicimonas sp.]|uniref:lipoprotein LpqH n=1 Tax=Propionicimonas sp. TaxID=1955623 RepID=UPI002B1EC691|nr:lipoprotein LpqH [Propionicimonas sp.]MEA4944174.1 lipoprotein LpqH [Propionicimonas sp.]